MALGDVTVSREQWVDMTNDIAFLRALEAAGVDNWEGYSIAHQIFSGELDEDDL